MKKIINLLKNNISFILTLIITFFVLTFELPYYIEAPGGLIDLKNRYEIEQSYDIKGSINMTYVSEYKATIATFLIAKLNNDLDIYKKEEILPNNITEEENDFLGEMLLKEASNNAIINAYKKAEKEYKIVDEKLYVTYIYEEAKTDLKIKDQIISVDGINVKNKQEINNIIKNKNINDMINIKVINNKKEYNRYAYVLKDNIIGIIATSNKKINTFPKIKVNYENNEFGSSGGLMTSLSIYSKLINYDITNGYTVSGTGTIDDAGIVGEIDGVKYKLKGAVKENADIFLVPCGDNYKEAIKLKKENNYDIEIVEVKTFDDVINYLNKKRDI
ncbi:MAG: hypothetical protein E7157_03245 [Lactobacillales bacterium]|nr:hypothetical protein [Lactobacillales bacterium]